MTWSTWRWAHVGWPIWRSKSKRSFRTFDVVQWKRDGDKFISNWIDSKQFINIGQCRNVPQTCSTWYRRRKCKSTIFTVTLRKCTNSSFNFPVWQVRTILKFFMAQKRQCSMVKNGEEWLQTLEFISSLLSNKKLKRTGLGVQIGGFSQNWVQVILR